jgi:Tape measure protein
MANSKDIELAIKTKDLASKPLQDIGASIDRLVSAVADLVPASEKGAKNFQDLTETATQLQKAMQGLKADAALVEQFAQLSASVAGASEKLKVLQAEADAAKLALANSAAPTKALSVAAESAASAANRQEIALGKLAARLETLKGKASAVGIDFNNLAAAQEKIDSAFAAAQPAYARVNEAIELYSMRQREAKVAAEAAAVASAQDAAKKETQAAAAAEATAMEQRFTVAMRQEGTAAAEAATQHHGLSQSFSLFRSEGLKSVEFIKDLRRELAGMAAGFFGLMGAIEAAKSGFESIEKLEGTKSLLTQTFGAEGAGQQLDYVRGQADRLSLSYVDLARNYAKFAAAAAGSGVDQSQTRQIFETFAEAARVKNLSAEQQSTIFGALDKIMAKDSVGATELFRKLSTDLPEAAAIFRKSIATIDDKPLTTDQFERLLKSGKITSEFVTKFAGDYRASFAEQLPEATHSTTAALESFGNAWTKFKIDILEGGALDAFKDVLLKLTAFFKSNDGKQFASELADGAKLAAKGVGLIVENVDALKDAVIALAAIWTFNVGKAFLSDLAKLGAQIDKYSLSLEAALARSSLLVQSLSKLGASAVAGFSGFQIGTWLNDNIAGVRQFGVLLTGYYITLFEGLKSIGKAAWDSIFGGETFKAAAAKAMAEIRATNADLRDQYHEAGKEPGEQPKTGEAGAAGSGGATPTVMTPQQKADAALAAQKALNDELLTASTSLQTKLSEMRGALLKKDATDLKGYLAGLSESFKPLYAEIEKLKQDFPHNSQALVDKLTAQLNSIKSLTLTDAGNKFNEDRAKSDLEEINALLRQRDQLIQNQSRKASEGAQSPELATKNIAGITAASNPAILADVQKLQGFITSLPANVQTKLQAVTAELRLTLDKLEERPATNALKDIKGREEEINQALEVRNAKMEAITAEQKAGIISTSQEKAQLKEINDEYAKTIQAAKDLIVFIQTTNTLTDDQKKSLDGTIAKLQVIVAGAKEIPTALYPAAKVADDIATGLTNVGAAFAKAAGHGHGLAQAFTAAWQAFKSFASDFLLKIGEMILKQTIMNALGFGTGGSNGGIAGAISGGISSLFGGGGSAIAATGAAAAGTDTGALASTIVPAFHSGGSVSPGVGLARIVSAAHFQFARRYHNGGTAGLAPDEIPIIAQTGERILSRAQVQAGVGGQQQPQHIQVNNLLDHEDIVRRGLASPSNVKVITNIIRANRAGIKQALA